MVIGSKATLLFAKLYKDLGHQPLHIPAMNKQKNPQTIPIAVHGGQPFTLEEKKQANKLLGVSIVLDKQEVAFISRLFKAIGFPSKELYPMTT